MKEFYTLPSRKVLVHLAECVLLMGIASIGGMTVEVIVLLGGLS